MKTPLVKKCLRNIWMVPIVGTPVRYSVRDIVRSTPKTVSTLAHGARSRNGTVFPTCLGGHGVRTFCASASGAALWRWISVKNTWDIKLRRVKYLLGVLYSYNFSVKIPKCMCNISRLFFNRITVQSLHNKKCPFLFGQCFLFGAL